MTKPLKLVIGLVHGQSVSGHYHHSMMHLMTDLMNRDDKIEILPITDTINVRSGPLLSLGRGVLASAFIDKTDADVLCTIDSDMSFSPTTIYQWWNIFQQLHGQDPKAAILGGIAFQQAGPTLDPKTMTPTLWSQDPLGRMVQHRVYQPNTLMEVAATGAACMMVHRDVFTTIGSHWYHHIPHGVDWTLLAQSAGNIDDLAKRAEYLRDAIYASDQLGEDLSFCIRAREHGFRIFVHSALTFDHAKEIVVGESDYLPYMQELQGVEA